MSEPASTGLSFKNRIDAPLLLVLLDLRTLLNGSTRSAINGACASDDGSGLTKADGETTCEDGGDDCAGERLRKVEGRGMATAGVLVVWLASIVACRKQYSIN